MMTPNDFSEYYKTISNTELLNILDNQGDYQPSAIEAVRKELINRKLSEIEIKEAKESLIAKQLQKEKQREKVKVIEDKVKIRGQILIKTLNPIQSGIPSTEKTIRLIVVVFGGLFLYQLIKDFRTHLAYVKDIPRFPFESVLYLLPFILLPMAIFAFWKRNTMGWTLLIIFLTFSAVAALWLLIHSFLWKPSGNSVLDSFFSEPPTLTIIIQLLFFIGTLYAICKQNVRDVFSISENKMIATLSITGVLSFFIVYANS